MKPSVVIINVESIVPKNKGRLLFELVGITFMVVAPQVGIILQDSF